jgi:hypothetical protein
MLGSTLQDLPSDSPAACRSACLRKRASPRTGAHQRTILACTQPVLVGHAVELAMPNHLTTTARSKPTPRLAQHRLRQLRAPGSQLRQTTSRSWTQRATTPTPAIPAIRQPAPPPRSRTSPRPDTADAATHRHRTPTPDADTGRRHRTPDSGHLDAQTPAPDTGHRSRGQASVDTGHSHRTPDTGRWPRTRTGDEGAAGIPTSWPPRRATARWDAQPCSCGRRLRRSTAHAGSAVRPPSSAR